MATNRKRPPIDNATARALDELYGPYASKHHARYHDPNVPYHVVFRALLGMALLTPTGELNDTIAGIIGRAQTIYTSVSLYAFAFLSNHVHLKLQGMTHEIPKFIGYIKKEASRRLSVEIDWPDTMWSPGYLSTALPTPESQVKCLEYILSQGVKEELVDRPEQWPGLHVAKQLLTGPPLTGRWLDGTRYGKALWKHRQKPEHAHKPLDKSAFTTTYEVALTPIAPWSALSVKQRRHKVAAMVADIVEKGRVARNGRPPMGVEAILKVPRTKRWRLPKLPWFEDRRRMIAWASRSAPETKQYHRQYWRFQDAYRAASDDYLAGNANAAFPEGSFRPPVFAGRVQQSSRAGPTEKAA